MSDFSMPLGGRCDARFDSVRELVTAKLGSGEDLGASLAVNIDGENLAGIVTSTDIIKYLSEQY